MLHPHRSATIANSLGRHPFLAGVAPDVLARLFAHATCFECGPDQTILDFEDPTSDVYLIIGGHVRVSIQTANGERTQILGDFTAGELFGEMSAVDGVPRSARIEALVRTQLCALPARPFVEAVLASRDLGLRLLRLLTARIRDQNRRMLEMTALPIRLRLASELLRLSRPRPDGSRSVSPIPTQEELAARIGARRETISRELSGLLAAGLMARTRTAIHLPDPVTLRATIDAGLDQPRPDGTPG